MAEAPAEAPFERVEYVVGPQIEVKGKVYWTMHPVNDPKNMASFDASAKSLKGIYTGQRYSIETDGTHFRFQTREWLGHDLDDTRRNTYQATQKAFELNRRAAALEAREGTSDKQLLHALEPLRVAYQKLPHPARLPFELWVLSVLRRKG